MNERALHDLSMESGLRAALDRDELVLHYQPQLDARSGDITGMEALVRWRSAELGLVPPMEFIPLAEEIGLIGRVGETVLREAFAQTRAWQDRELPPLRLAVNVSSQQMRRPEPLERVRGTLGEAGLDPRHVELEITESALLGDELAVMENLQGLKALGVRLALDDFGTGFSSLSHIVRFPIDVLKVDQAFVHGIGGAGQSDAVISAVVAMAHRLGLCVVAEGVETEEQECFLRAQECDVLQGFRFGRPLEPARFEALLAGSAVSDPDRTS